MILSHQEELLNSDVRHRYLSPSLPHEKRYFPHNPEKVSKSQSPFPSRILEIRTAEIVRPIRAARVSMPISASTPVSDREDDHEEDEDVPEVDDSEILADLPDDTDVRRPLSTLTRARNR